MNYDGADHSHLALKQEGGKKTQMLKWYGSPASALHMIIGKCLEKESAILFF